MKEKNNNLNYKLKSYYIKNDAPKSTNTIIHIICVKSM